MFRKKIEKSEIAESAREEGLTPKENSVQEEGLTQRESLAPKERKEQKKLVFGKAAGKRARQRRVLFVMLSLLAFALIVAFVLLREHYLTYPARLERDSIRLIGRGNNYLALRWDAVRNAAEYKVYYKESDAKEVRDSKEPEAEKGQDSDEVTEPEGKYTDEITEPETVDDSWDVKSTAGTEMMFSGLKQGTAYSFIIRPDSETVDGKLTMARDFSTKRKQKLKVDERITKLSISKPFDIEAGAKTDVRYESEDKTVVDVDEKTGKLVPKGAGVTTVKVEALENAEYTGKSETLELEVIETEAVSAGGASAFNIYHLSPDNCEVVKEIEGAGGAVIPQSFGYTGDQYIVAYGMGNPNRIISFDADGDGKEVSVPGVALGHPNGFTYADENGTCYSVKGWSSRVATYVPETGEYGAFNLTYGCSGIAYDRKEKRLYTSSRTLMASYDIGDGYSVANTCGVVRHSASLATQDIGGHGGIMLRCLSPNGNKHGTNYIDLYDMRNGMYYGSITCDLSEVESAIVNKDGFLEILANNSGATDYIWRTNINIESLSQDLPE